MRKIVSVILVTALLLAGLFVLTGCGTDGNAEKSNANTANLDYKSMTAEDLLSKIKDRENVTAEEWIALVSTYSNVEIKDDLTLEKSITDEAIKAIPSKARPSLDSYLPSLLESEVAQVRGYGISLITSLTGVSSKNLELAKKLIKTETNPYVLLKATSALSNEAKSDKEVADFLIKMSTNENAKIRKAAASALANSWSKGVEGVKEAVVKLMNDADTDVRKAACSGSGKLADESLVEPLVAILNNPDDADVHASCIEGLAHMWYDYPFFENTSEKAYKATMDYYKKTPRTDKVPAWNGLSAFSTKPSKEEDYTAWKAKATYFSEDEIYNVMTDLIKDSNAGYLARSTAINIVKAHCSAEKFAELKTVVDGLTDSKASSVKSAYDSKAK